jgi:integrase
MGDIIKRTLKDGTIALYGRFVDHEGKRVARATGAKTEEAAQKWLERAEMRAEAGLPVEANSTRKRRKRVAVVAAPAPVQVMTVRQLCEKFKAEYQGDVADIKHYRRQAWSVLKCHALPTLGALDAALVKRSDIMRLTDSLKNGKKSAFIISRVLRQLSRVFNWAIERELLVNNPVRGVKKPKTQGSTKHYTDDEMAKLLAWAAEHAPGLHTLIAFAFYTGCRKGEIAALRWSDIDWQGLRIVIQRSWKKNARKSGQPVVVNMHPHLAAILTAHQQRSAGEGEALVFPADNGRMRSKFDLWGLDDAIAATKVRRFRYPWHAFRHTHATNLAIGGAGLTAIRDALGQATLHMAANYTHLAAEHVREHVDKLPTIGPTSPTVASLDEARAKKGKNGKEAKRRADIKHAVSADS